MQDNDLPIRFCAGKIIEGDKLIIEQLKLDDHEKETVDIIAGNSNGVAYGVMRQQGGGS